MEPATGGLTAGAVIGSRDFTLQDLFARPRAETRTVQELSIHPDRHSRHAQPDEDEQLLHTVKTGGILLPIRVTGKGCASPPNVVLDGARRLEAAKALGWTEIEVLVIDGLDDAHEALYRDSAQLYARVHDELPVETLVEIAAELFRHYRNITGMRRGFRSDLTSTSGSRGSVSLPPAAEWVGKQMNVSRSQAGNLRLLGEVAKVRPDVARAVYEGKLAVKDAVTALRPRKSPKLVKVLGPDAGVARGDAAEASRPEPIVDPEESMASQQMAPPSVEDEGIDDSGELDPAVGVPKDVILASLLFEGLGKMVAAAGSWSHEWRDLTETFGLQMTRAFNTLLAHREEIDELKMCSPKKRWTLAYERIALPR